VAKPTTLYPTRPAPAKGKADGKDTKKTAAVP
jgi:hypothetical protein